MAPVSTLTSVAVDAPQTKGSIGNYRLAKFASGDGDGDDVDDDDDV